MLALLVSILGDVYDRVRVAEKAEQNKARAWVIHVSERMNRQIRKVLPAFEERRKGAGSFRSPKVMGINASIRDVYCGIAGEK